MIATDAQGVHQKNGKRGQSSMADRRMFAKTIVLSDAFLDMPMSSRCLYFTLGMLADDDGFIGNPKSIMRQCGASLDDMMALIQKRYVLDLGNGVIVIKHWRMNNYLRLDRHKPTTYLEELGTLTIDDKGAYTEKDKCGCQVVGNMATQISIGKDRLGKDSKDIRHKHGQYNNVMLSDTELETLKNEFDDWQERIEKVSCYCASTGKSYKNYLATIRNWARKETPKKNDELPVYDASSNEDMDLSRVDEILRGRNHDL